MAISLSGRWQPGSSGPVTQTSDTPPVRAQDGVVGVGVGLGVIGMPS